MKVPYSELAVGRNQWQTKVRWPNKCSVLALVQASIAVVACVSMDIIVPHSVLDDLFCSSQVWCLKFHDMSHWKEQRSLSLSFLAHWLVAETPSV